MKRIKVAIVASELLWTGGVDFLIDFIKVLELHPEQYQCEVFINQKNKYWDKISRLKNRSYYKDRDRLLESIKNECENVKIVGYKENLISKDRQYEDVKKKAVMRGVDVLMTMNTIMDGIKDERYVTVSYVYDLQHKYYPELFDPDEIVRRDYYFPKLMRCCDCSFTQSYDTLNDIRKYYSDAAGDLYVMYAYPHKNKDIDGYAININEKYGINHPYFMVCNQFWMHKNHKVVFDALELLDKEGIKDVMVVCTGSTEDFRNPNYYPKVQNYISGLKCKDRIKILGYIDKKDQVFLLNHSISLVQPTLFEGNPGGGAVVDAEAYGIPCIVSDIPVNREIPDYVEHTFFEAKDPHDLAKAMKEALSKYDPQITYESKVDYEKCYEQYDNTLRDMINRKKERSGVIVRNKNCMTMKCKLCGTMSPKVFSESVLKKYSVSYYQCPHCNLLFTEKPYWLNEAYDKAITDTDTGVMVRNINNAVMACSLLGKWYSKDDMYVDYGGGYGLFVRLMRDAGYDFRWYDQYAKPLVCDGFKWDENSNKKAKVLFAFEVFEHFDRIIPMLKEIVSKSEDFLISTEIYDKRDSIRDKSWWYYQFNTGQHISFYSEKTISYIAHMLKMHCYRVAGYYWFTKRKVSRIAILKFTVLYRLKLYHLKWIGKLGFKYSAKDMDEIDEKK